MIVHSRLNVWYFRGDNMLELDWVELNTIFAPLFARRAESIAVLKANFWSWPDCVCVLERVP